MRRTLFGLACIATVASAYGLYAISASTRRLERSVQALEARRDKLRDDVQLLRADRAYLARPERIEPMARLQGLEPLRRDQLITPDDLARRLHP
jgi:cell division protein FtsL